jgi:hypothetical protein
MKRLLYILALGTIISSCEREKGYEGPSLIDLYGDFSVIDSLQVTNTNVAFAAGETSVFKAEFSKKVDWEIVIKGDVSNAEKVISGSSRILDEYNATWDGSTTNFPMFKSESCKISLAVSYNINLGDSIISVTDSIIASDKLNVASIKVNKGLLLSDFESGFSQNWDNRSLSSLGGVDIINEFTDVTLSTQAGVNFGALSTVSPQGNSFFNLAGSCSWDWLIGMLVMPAESYSDGASTYNLNENPNNVYFNFLLNVPENISNAKLLIRFYEDDNNNGIFESSSEDMYSIWQESFDVGWQTISVRYSDLEALDGGSPVLPVGNGARNPNLLKAVDFLLLADPSSGFSQVQMDYVIFTDDEPLKP